jgi:hypothetical protein
MDKEKFDFCMRMIDYYDKKDEPIKVFMYASIISKAFGLPIIEEQGKLDILDRLGMTPNVRNFGIN